MLDSELRLVISLAVMVLICVMAAVIAKLVDRCHDHWLIRDDVSDISENTRNLLKAKVVLNWLRTPKGSTVADSTTADKAASMAKKWRLKTLRGAPIHPMLRGAPVDPDDTTNRTAEARNDGAVDRVYDNSTFLFSETNVEVLRDASPSKLSASCVTVKGSNVKNQGNDLSQKQNLFTVSTSNPMYANLPNSLTEPNYRTSSATGDTQLAFLETSKNETNVVTTESSIPFPSPLDLVNLNDTKNEDLSIDSCSEMEEVNKVEDAHFNDDFEDADKRRNLSRNTSPDIDVARTTNYNEGVRKGESRMTKIGIRADDELTLESGTSFKKAITRILSIFKITNESQSHTTPRQPKENATKDV